jgi:hypothetical protein
MNTVSTNDALSPQKKIEDALAMAVMKKIGIYSKKYKFTRSQYVNFLYELGGGLRETANELEKMLTQQTGE